MQITKTIGGDRLGSGKKMKQSYHDYERSNHDLSYVWTSSMAAGTLVPCMAELMLPGDTFDIDIDTLTFTHPTIGPLFGSYKLQVDIFSIPFRLYQAQLHNNKQKIGMNMSSIKLPQLVIKANNIDLNSSIPVDLQQINGSCILAYLGQRGIGINAGVELESVEGEFNALKYLGYYDIYKCYYANPQEEIGAIIDYVETPQISINEIKNRLIYSPFTEEDLPFIVKDHWEIVVKGENLDKDQIRITLDGEIEYPWTEVIFTNAEVTDEDGNIVEIRGVGNGTILGKSIENIYVENDAVGIPEPQITTFPLSNIDDMREDILAGIKDTAGFKITKDTYAPYGNTLTPTNNSENSKIRGFLPLQGLALKTYQSDLFNNWMKTSWIDGPNGISELSSVDVTGGALKIDALNLATKIYNMMNRIAISGGTYYNWIEAIYSEKGFNMVETPIYEGGLSKEIIFQEVISNSESEGQPLGTLAGRGIQSDKHKGGRCVVKTKEPSYVMAIVSLTPRLTYSQGNKWDVNLKTMDDLHKPELDAIGFQDLITEQMAWWTTQRSGTLGPMYRSAGKQPAWINYMTNVNQAYGRFADERDEMFMTLNRRYEMDRAIRDISDLTTYVDPKKFNYMWAEIDRSAQHFWMQMSINISARRKVSAKQIPNL